MSERSFAVGTIAEIVDALAGRCLVFVETLYPLVMDAVRDEDEEVRSNAIYACGVLAQHGGQTILPYPSFTPGSSLLYRLMPRQ